MKRLRMVIGVALICGCLQLAAASPAGAASLTLTVDGTTGVAIGTGSSVHLLVRASGQRIGNTAVLESLSHGQYKELTQCQIQVPALRVLGSCTYDYTGEEPGTGSTSSSGCGTPSISSTPAIPMRYEWSSMARLRRRTT